MLKSLSINNFVIIDELSVNFSDSLNIITGETGAGKSILLGALGLIKGERAQSQMIGINGSKCTIKAVFDTSNVKKYQENEMTIVRQISTEGSSKSYINDEKVKLTDLQEIGSKLIDIHSQHDSLDILKSAYQLEVLDSFGEYQKLLEAYKEKFKAYLSKEKELKILKESAKMSDAEKELSTFHLSELTQIELETIDIEKLESELQLLENAEEIKHNISAFTSVTITSEVNVLDTLREMNKNLKKFNATSDSLNNLNERLEETIDNLSELSRDYERENENIEYDAAQIDELKDKVDIINKLLVKHSKRTVDELIELKEYLRKSLEAVDNTEDSIIELENEVESLKQSCISIAHDISQERRNTKSILEEKLIAKVHNLNLENAVFEIEINTDKEKLTTNGIDEVKFLFSANIGVPVRELKSAISGGEMSRVMLAMKSLIAEKIKMPTIVFDEIDTGVSGVVAYKVAKELKSLSQSHQMIAITHLPQIASQGNKHFKIFKSVQENMSITNMEILSAGEREQEIAQMISGEEITDSALMKARELLSE